MITKFVAFVAVDNKIVSPPMFDNDEAKLYSIALDWLIDNERKFGMYNLSEVVVYSTLVNYEMNQK